MDFLWICNLLKPYSHSCFDKIKNPTNDIHLNPNEYNNYIRKYSKDQLNFSITFRTILRYFEKIF